MKGIIFNLAEEVLAAAYGDDAWDAVLEASNLEGAYTSLGSYPDEELGQLVTAASRLLERDPATIVREIGEGSIPLLAQRYPQFFERHTSTRSFVLTLNDIIHPEVRKIYPGAQVPEFDFDTSDEDVLVVDYRSDRKLCALAEGFIAGAATHYGERAEITQSVCMLNGGDLCRIACRFEVTDAGRAVT